MRKFYNYSLEEEEINMSEDAKKTIEDEIKQLKLMLRDRPDPSLHNIIVRLTYAINKIT
jgi:hypothetical protein